VGPESGEVCWLILPRVEAKVFSVARSHCAKEVGAGKDKRVLLVLDQAGWHTGGEVEVPEGIHLQLLPARSPELQPAERLWPLATASLAKTGALRTSTSWKRRSWSAAWRSRSKPNSSAPSRSTTTGGLVQPSNGEASMWKR
jgi:hypothetical protein